MNNAPAIIKALGERVLRKAGKVYFNARDVMRTMCCNAFAHAIEMAFEERQSKILLFCVLHWFLSTCALIKAVLQRVGSARIFAVTCSNGRPITIKQKIEVRWPRKRADSVISEVDKRKEEHALRVSLSTRLGSKQTDQRRDQTVWLGNGIAGSQGAWICGLWGRDRFALAWFRRESRNPCGQETGERW